MFFWLHPERRRRGDLICGLSGTSKQDIDCVNESHVMIYTYGGENVVSFDRHFLFHARICACMCACV